jgi:hypothetical protein
MLLKKPTATHTGRTRIVGATIHSSYISITRQCDRRIVSTRYYSLSPDNLARAQAAGAKDRRPRR